MCQDGSGYGCPHKTAKHVGRLALRLALGFIFIYMGYSKLGPGHVGTAGMMSAIGLPGSGDFWAYFVGTLELAGGLMVLLGIYARYAATWLAVILIVAMLTVHRGSPAPGYFLPLSALGGLLAIIGGGAGRYRLVKGECHCRVCREKCVHGESDCCGGDKKMAEKK